MFVPLITRRLFTPAIRHASLRGFHVSTRRYASSMDPEEMARMMESNPQIRETAQKLAQHPGAMNGIQNIMRILQAKGIEPGQAPSKMMLLKLMMDSEFRQAAQELGQEMEKAGIKLDQETIMKMMEGKQS